MSLVLSNYNLYLTYNDTNDQLTGDAYVLNKLVEQLENYNPKYGIACKEVGPTGGNKHFHVLIMCEKRIQTRKGEKLITIDGIRPHVERINNNINRIIQYIKKGGYTTEFNPENRPKTVIKPSRQEKAKLMMQGNLEELFMNGDLGAVDVIRATKLKSIFEMNRAPKEYKKKIVVWFHGNTGEGKTKTALEIAKQYYNNNYWMSSDSLKWFDGYTNQRVAIIDDFRKGMLSDWSFLLRLLDGYNLLVQVKGGFTTWSPELIIITSPATPHEAFSWVNKEGEEKEWDKQEQLTRRLTHQEELQLYEFPLWKEEQLRLENTIRKELGLAPIEEESMFPEEWSVIEPEGFITPG